MESMCSLFCVLSQVHVLKEAFEGKIKRDKAGAWTAGMVLDSACPTVSAKESPHRIWQDNERVLQQ